MASLCRCKLYGCRTRRKFLAKAYRSINEAIEYFANVQATDGVERFEILVREGDCYPRYSFTNLDPKTATINVLKTERPLVIKGGYRVEDDGSAAQTFGVPFRDRR